MVYLNVFYKANDFIQHGPERVNFGESFKELADKPFAFYILYFEILIRIYFNNLKFASDFVVFNYFNNFNATQSFRYLENFFYNIYCMHLKK